MEVYGTKPKPFTKEWWPYFWEYYKLHTIGVILAGIMIFSFVSECSNQKNYDLQIDVITENPVPDSAVDALTAFATENTADVTKNGQNEAYVLYLDMNMDREPQFAEAMHTKMMVETGYTEGFVFLVSKKYADSMSETGVFKPASDWTDTESYNDFCINLSGNEILEGLGIDTGDLYLGIVELRERDKKSEREKNRPKQQNGIEFAKILLGER